MVAWRRARTASGDRRAPSTAGRDVISVQSIIKISTDGLALLELSSPNPMEPFEHRNPYAQMKQCLEGKGFLRTYVSTPVDRSPSLTP